MESIGKYQIVERIGAGGFGEVYKGFDPLIKRHVAVKTCNSSDPQISQRFFREAEIAGNLHHRNVTTVYDFGVEDSLPFLIQEFLSGEDLDRKIKRRDFLPYPEKLYYLLQISRGLAYAHSEGVIHRDVKPANIRVLEDGTVKIMDFGIAKLAQQESGLTQTGMTLGTAAYLAPEQVRGEEVGHYTDVFSFGVLAYELLTYKRPFRGKQISQVLYQLINSEPEPIPEIWPAAPPEIVALVDRCLAKDPAERYRDGSELLRELERLRAAGGEHATAAMPIHDRDTRPITPTDAGSEPATAPPEPASTAAGLDEIELSPTPEVERTPVPTETRVAVAARPSRAPALLVLAGLAAVALAAGWWLGTRDRPAAETGAAEAPPPASELGMPEDVTDRTAEEAGESAGTEGGDRQTVDEPPVDEPPAAAPPPAAPESGTVVLERVAWTDSMTLRLAGETYRLSRPHRIPLPPGSYEAEFRIEIEGYARREAVPLRVESGQRHALAPPIPRPGALSVRPYPGRPQGDVWLDGELLAATPIRKATLAPGGHTVEIRPRGGEEPGLEHPLTIASGQEAILTFDLENEKVSQNDKPLPQ